MFYLTILHTLPGAGEYTQMVMDEWAMTYAPPKYKRHQPPRFKRLIKTIDEFLQS